MTSPAVRFGLSHHCAPTNPVTARRQTDPAIQAGYRGFAGERLEALLVGGPEEVIAEVEKYRALGCTHSLFRHIVRERRQMLSSIRLIGEKFIPFFSSASA